MWIPWNTYINTEGKVTPCCMIPDPNVLSLGSIEKTNFNKIWNSKTYQDFRNDINLTN